VILIVCYANTLHMLQTLTNPLLCCDSL
jgi:hypothetical protein